MTRLQTRNWTIDVDWNGLICCVTDAHNCTAVSTWLFSGSTSFLSSLSSSQRPHVRDALIKVNDRSKRSIVGSAESVQLLLDRSISYYPNALCRQLYVWSLLGLWADRSATNYSSVQFTCSEYFKLSTKMYFFSRWTSVLRLNKCVMLATTRNWD